MRTTVITGVCVALIFASASVQGQIAVSSNDHKMTQENGVTKNLANPPPDSITIIDLGTVPVKVVGTVSDVPGSVVGPPLSVAITPDESLALVGSSSKFDPADESPSPRTASTPMSPSARRARSRSCRSTARRSPW